MYTVESSNHSFPATSRLELEDTSEQFRELHFWPAILRTRAGVRYLMMMAHWCWQDRAELESGRGPSRLRRIEESWSSAETVYHSNNSCRVKSEVGPLSR